MTTKVACLCGWRGARTYVPDGEFAHVRESREPDGYGTCPKCKGRLVKDATALDKRARKWAKDAKLDARHYQGIA